MTTSSHTISDLAQLSNLELADEELRRLEGEFQDIVAFVDALERAGTSDVAPTGQVTELENVFRHDAVDVFPHPRTLVERASRHGDFFLAPPPLREG